MSKVYITKRFTFEACHRLDNYAGKCSNLHGHSYKLEVTASGVVGENRRMVIDFSALKRIVEEDVVESHDHNYLNNIYKEPTAENMVIGIFKILDKTLKDKSITEEDVTLESVKLWETEDSYAEYRGE